MSEEYIANFEAKMANLNNIKQQIEENLNAKKNFTETLKTSLVSINQRLADLAKLINTLKEAKDTLTHQITNNSSSIETTTNEITNLNNEIIKLGEEKKTVELNAGKQIGILTTQIHEKQKQIDDFESTIRNLESQKNEENNKATILKEQLNSFFLLKYQ